MRNRTPYALKAPTRLLAAALGLAAGLVLAACSPGGAPTPAELKIAVDPTLAPSVTQLPPFDDGEPRPLAVIEGENGVPATFVANELWLQTDDEEAVAALVARWHGTVLLSLTRADHGLADLPGQYLIRVDASGASTEALVTDLRKLEPTARGNYGVSSSTGLDLLAAGSHEAAAGVPVGLNWVGSAGDFRSSDVREAPAGDALATNLDYQPNPFLWPSHQRGGAQDIGVAAAWRALDLAGKLGNRVKLAILDMGFRPDADLPSGWTAISNVPYADPTEDDNLLGCGDSDCPWHGTNVASAAMAVAGNGFGSAGPAGPVAQPVLVYTLYDFFTSITALTEARVAGAHIANMSYSAGVPWYLAWSVLPFEATTAALRYSGMLMFAAAGNDGKNVDGTTCAPLVGCWEDTWYTPCENNGVICVGGLRVNSVQRSSHSNYGHEQVDIYAPFTLWVGPDPDHQDNRAHVVNGTSFSSPFVAGVAALVWAADPGLSADDVEDIIMRTAHEPEADAGKRVNALAAVLEALGNVAPTFDLAGSMTALLNVPAQLSITPIDIEDPFPCCTVTWRSNVDGALGTGWSIEPVFTTTGPRTITVTATDSGGASTSRATVLNVVNEAPQVTLTSPADGAEVYRTGPVLVRAQASDRNEPDEALECSGLTWTSSEPADADFPVTGCVEQVTFTTNGPRTLTVTATDPQGAQDAASVTVTVVDPPANFPPLVRIEHPTHHQRGLLVNAPMALTGTAVDPEGATALAYRWTVQLFDGPEIEVGTTADASWTPTDDYTFNQAGTYTVQVRLYVTDPGGAVGVDRVELEWVIIL